MFSCHSLFVSVQSLILRSSERQVLALLLLIGSISLPPPFFFFFQPFPTPFPSRTPFLTQQEATSAHHFSVVARASVALHLNECPAVGASLAKTPALIVYGANDYDSMVRKAS